MEHVNIQFKTKNHQRIMLLAKEQFLNSGEFADVTLACQGRSLKSHKVLLSSYSCFFYRLLLENPCKHPIIIMKDFRFDILKAIIEFIYQGSVNVPKDDVADFLSSARTLQIKDLSDSGKSNRLKADEEKKFVWKQKIENQEQIKVQKDSCRKCKKKGQISNTSHAKSIPNTVNDEYVLDPEIDILSETSHDSSVTCNELLSSRQDVLHQDPIQETREEDKILISPSDDSEESRPCSVAVMTPNDIDAHAFERDAVFCTSPGPSVPLGDEEFEIKATCLVSFEEPPIYKMQPPPFEVECSNLDATETDLSCKRGGNETRSNLRNSIDIGKRKKRARHHPSKNFKKNSEDSTNKGSLSCMLCTQRFRTESTLNNHLFEHAKLSPNECRTFSESQKICPLKTGQEKSPILTCDNCFKTYQHISTLKRHKKLCSRDLSG